MCSTLIAAGGTAAGAQKPRTRTAPGWVSSRGSLTQNPQTAAAAAAAAASSSLPGPASNPPAAGGVAPGLPRVGGPASQTLTGGASTPVPATGALSPVGDGSSAAAAQQQLEAQHQFSMPGTPSHSSSPSSPVRDFNFSRPPYVLWSKNGERRVVGWFWV